MISEHFTESEMADPATGETKFAMHFIRKLETLRTDYGHPMIVTSGCRSQEHNEWLKRRGYQASPNSFHLMDNPKYQTGGTCAVDIARPNGNDLATLIGLALSQGWSIGIANTFIHLDLRTHYTALPQVIYTYS
jgi:hypothetical protein